MAVVDMFVEILRAPTVAEIICKMAVFLAPVGIAFFIGILFGWSWKPSRVVDLGDSKLESTNPSPPLPSAAAAAAAATTSPAIVSDPSSSISSSHANFVQKDQIALASVQNPSSSSLQGQANDDVAAVGDEEFEHLHRLVERKDGGPTWKLMMERSTSDMTYQAWQRDQETGPPQYCSRSVYEDTTPEMLRDFFWDDEFRLKWDDMLLQAETLKECPSTGNMIVHWIRKFPFFCSDREYIIGRRIWESGRSYYCVTKGVPCDFIPRKDKPRRVDLYYSSWFIGAVASKKDDGGGELSACEVVLFHHEDMGIPWEIAKFGVKQGMWGAVKKIARGIQMYKKERSSGAPLSHTATMAQISTKISPDNLKCIENGEVVAPETQAMDDEEEDTSRKGVNVRKLMIIGGVLAVACTLDKGLITKTIIFSVARRFANLGRNPRT